MTRRKQQLPMSRNTIEWIIIGVCIVLLVGTLIGAMVIPPYFEMQSFNKLTCPAVEATYWDAMFAELRVDGSNCPEQ